MNSLSSILLPPLIGITGRKGVGKDTVANHLVTVFGYTRYSFADPMKQALSVMFDVPLEVFNDPAHKEIPCPMLLGHTPRHLMQTLGTEWGRDKIHTDMWSTLGLRRIEVLRSCGQSFIVVPDVRFDNEAEAICQAGGFIWEVTRPDSTYGEGDTHRSESGISHSWIDTQIKNNTDTRMLFAQVGVAIKNAAAKLSSQSNQSPTV